MSALEFFFEEGQENASGCSGSWNLQRSMNLINIGIQAAIDQGAVKIKCYCLIV